MPLAILLLVAGTAAACSIPVFRYALTRWRATPYVALVVHEKPLSEDHEGIVEYLKKKASDKDTRPNLRVQKLDLNENEDARKELDPEQTPRIMLMHPQLPPGHRIMWKGPMKKKAIDRMVDSPVRQKLAQRLLNNHAAVWVLVESGNESRDNRARKLLKEQLDSMEEKVMLPMGYQGPGSSSGSDSGSENKNAVEFSMLRLKRSDPKEGAFVSTLLHTEPGLTKDKYKDQPMAFPIFGRGRALYALVGEGINKQNIARVSSFLVGGCQCQVKSAAPGTDLLLAADWSSVKYSGGRGGAPPSVQGAMGGRRRSPRGAPGRGGRR
jgi:hypothetical protein